MNKTEITEIHPWMTELETLHTDVRIKSNTYSGASYGFFADMGDELILKVTKEWRESVSKFDAIWVTLTPEQKRYWYEWQSQKMYGHIK